MAPRTATRLDERFPELLARGFQEEILVLSPELTVLHANDRFLDQHGAAPEQILNAPCHSVLQSCRRFCEEFTGECPVHKAMSLGGPTTVTHRDVPFEDEVHHFKIHVYPVESRELGRCYLHITRDITERIEQERLRDNMWMEILKQMEDLYTEMVEEGNKLEQLKRRFDHLKDNAPLAMVAWDSAGRIRQWNANAEILFGWTESEIIDRPFCDLFASGDSHDQMARIQKAILQGQELDYSVNENRTASGDIIICEWYHSAAEAESGRSIPGGLSMGQDISENVKAAETLRRTQAQTEALLRAVDDAVVGVNHLGRIVFWNEAAERLLGWSRDAAVGREIEILLPAEARLDLGRRMRAFFAGNEGSSPSKRSLEAELAGQNGQSFPARLTLFAERSGEEGSGILVVRDLSEARRLERLLSQSEKMRSLGEMASGVAHDLNNHLTAVLGNLQLLKQSLSGEELLAQVDRAEQAARRGAERTSELQAYVKGGSGGEESRFELLDLGQLIQEVVDLTRFRWKDQTEKTGHTIEVVTDISELPPLILNGPDIRELLTNLMLNAVEAMPRGGRLHIVAGQEGEEVRVKVQDNGQGMSRLEQSRAFEPFFTTKGSEHAGMGLNIARNIAGRHGGDLTISSIKGAGTTLTLSLPLQSEVEDLPDLEAGKGLSLRILLVEDEELIRGMLKLVLEKAGHQVTEAENGRAGVDRFRRDRFDLVITDHGMPEMNGEELAFRIKRSDPEVPLILISGWSRDLGQLQHKPGLIDEMLDKPIDLQSLIRAVQRLGRRRQTDPSAGS